MTRTIIGRISASDPTPLYLQIAERIREQIQLGELAEGDALTPLREAAEAWGVNVHTVRHAYTSLAREGLVESRGSRGTRVLGGSATRAASSEARARSGAVAPFLNRVLDEARELGISPDVLAAAITDRIRAIDPPVVYVVECSEMQCLSHSREIEAAWSVAARPWSLDGHDEAPPGAFVATFFHYNDIRRRWPHRLRDARFVAIAPDPAIRREVQALAVDEHRMRVIVVERDGPTADNIAADLSVLLPESEFEVTPVAHPSPQSAIEDLGERDVAVFPPRAWSDLSLDERSNPRAIQARYIISAEDLHALGRECGWSPATKSRIQREIS